MKLMNRRNFIRSAGITACLTPVFCDSLFSMGLKADCSGYGYVDSVKFEILDWMDKVLWDKEGWGRYKYNYHMMRDYALESSAMAFEILNMYNEIEKIPREKRQDAVEFFQFCQDPEDKFFKDPLLAEKDRVRDNHTWEHNWAHMSGAAITALKIFGAEPLYKRDKPPFKDINQENVESWVRSLEWKNPWMVGEHFSRNIKGYWNNLPEKEKSQDNPVIKKAYNIVEKEVMDKETGLPLKKGCENRAVGMAGLFKIMFSYLHTGREIPYAEKAIDSIMNLQDDDGEFGEGDVRNNMCINWDSLCVIHNLSKQLDNSYKINDIKSCGNKTAEFLLNVHRKKDGGFSFHRDYCQMEHNSFRISKKYFESDMQGVKMSLKCLSYADTWNEL